MWTWDIRNVDVLTLAGKGSTLHLGYKRRAEIALDDALASSLVQKPPPSGNINDLGANSLRSGPPSGIHI